MQVADACARCRRTSDDSISKYNPNIIHRKPLTHSVSCCCSVSGASVQCIMKFNNALPAVALIVFSTIVIALRRSKTGVSRVSFPKPIPYRVSFPKPIPYRVSFSPTPTKFNTTSYSCEPNLQLQPRPIQPRKGAIHEIENLRLKLPPDSIYSNLKLTYDRIVLPESNCQDVFISVRTAAPFHKSRLPLLLYTWLQTVNPKQVWCSVWFIYCSCNPGQIWSCLPGPNTHRFCKWHLD